MNRACKNARQKVPWDGLPNRPSALVPVRRRIGNPSSMLSRRVGAALLMTIVCLVVVASLAVSLARSLVAEHRQARLRCNQMQAFWLAESAVQRGVVRLAAAPEYAGEDWQVEVQVGGGPVRARATIRVEAVEGDPPRRRLVVEARCPADGDASVLQTRELIVALNSAEGRP